MEAATDGEPALQPQPHAELGGWCQAPPSLWEGTSHGAGRLTAGSDDEPEPPDAAAHAVAARDEVGEQAGQRAREEVHHAKDGGQVGSLGDAEAKVVLEEGRQRIVKGELHRAKASIGCAESPDRAKTISHQHTVHQSCGDKQGPPKSKTNTRAPRQLTSTPKVYA